MPATSRVVPHLLLDSSLGELFVVRNVGNFVPPFDASHGYHDTVDDLLAGVDLLQ